MPRTMSRENEDALIERATKIMEARTLKYSESPLVTSPDDIKKLLVAKCFGMEREHFGIVTLDNRHRLINIHPDVAVGTINQASIYLREVFKILLSDNSAACMLYHNHPSGNCTPSRADLDITNKIKRLASELEVRVLDHIIVGGTSTYSMAERGDL